MANILSAVSGLTNMVNAALLDPALQALKESQNSAVAVAEGYRVDLSQEEEQAGRAAASQLSLGGRLSLDLQALNQATLQANDGIAMTQISGMTLNDIHADLAQMQKLVQASRSGSLSAEDRQSLQEEAKKLQAAIDQKIHMARYNDIPLLASTRAVLLQAGIESGSQNTVTLQDVSRALTPVDLGSAAGVEAAESSLSKDLPLVAGMQRQMASKQGEFTAAIDRLSAWSAARTGMGGSIDSDQAATQAANRIAALIRGHAGMAFNVQANQSPARVANLV
jgi:flagellin